MTAETQIGHQYEVANIGARPHNLEAIEVTQLASLTSQEELSILCLKPGFHPLNFRTGAPTQKYIENLVTSTDLDVLCTAETSLSGVEVCELYRDVLPPNPEDDARFGTDWKRNLITYMASGTMFSYLIKGDDAYQKTRTVKNFLRKLNTIEGDETTKVIENVGHVPDPKDFELSLQILFLGGLVINTLEDSQRI